MRPASLTGAHVPSTPAGTIGFHRLNISGSSDARRALQPPSAARPKTVSSSDPSDEHRRLHRFGVGHRAHAAEHRVEPGEHDDRHRSDPEAVERQSGDGRDRQTGQQDAEHDAAGEDADRHLGEHVGDERDQRQHPARRRREAALEELGHRVDARAHVEGHHHPAEHQQAPRVQLEVRQRHAARGARAGEADEVLGADVRREDRGADHHPAQMTAGEEVVVHGGAIAQNRPPREAEQQGEVGPHGDPVERRHGAVDSIRRGRLQAARAG